MTRVAGCLGTGQRTCHDPDGREIACAGSGQDAEFRAGVPWPAPRLRSQDDIVIDDLTGLCWWRHADIADGAVGAGQKRQARFHVRAVANMPREKRSGREG